MQVARPPQEIFSYLAQFEKTPEWLTPCMLIESRTPEPRGRGTRLRYVCRTCAELRASPPPCESFTAIVRLALLWRWPRNLARLSRLWRRSARTIVDVNDAFFSGNTEAQRKAVVRISPVDVEPIAFFRPQSVIRPRSPAAVPVTTSQAPIESEQNKLIRSFQKNPVWCGLA